MNPEKAWYEVARRRVRKIATAMILTPFSTPTGARAKNNSPRPRAASARWASFSCVEWRLVFLEIDLPSC